MIDPRERIAALLRAPSAAARDLATIADAVRILPDIAGGLRTVAGAVQALREDPRIGLLSDRLPGLVDAVLRVPEIEALVVEVAELVRVALTDVGQLRETVTTQHAEIRSAVADVAQLREVVVTQHGDVEQMKAMLAAVDRRTALLTEILTELQALARDASQALPDPDAPGPLARAREAISGAIESGSEG
jgi:hypothetical protein